MEHKQLSSKKLLEAVDAALLAGRLMLQYGAETEKVEHTIYNIGYALGCDGLSSVITHNSIILTVTSGVEYRTKIIKVVRQGVNYDIVSRVSVLSQKARREGVTLEYVKSVLESIESLPQNYSHTTTVVMASLACGAFSILFGGDYQTFIAVFIAAFFGMNGRIYLAKKQFNALLVPMISAFLSTSIASFSGSFTDNPEVVFASSVLYLIPGVQLINAAEDIIKGHFVVGFTRGFMGILISLSIAFGITFGLLFTRELL